MAVMPTDAEIELEIKIAHIAREKGESMWWQRIILALAARLDAAEKARPAAGPMPWRLQIAAMYLAADKSETIESALRAADSLLSAHAATAQEPR